MSSKKTSSGSKERRFYLHLRSEKEKKERREGGKEGEKEAEC